MQIINDIKLDFSDVLIRPKRSTLVSRKEVNLHRTLKMKHSSSHWSGIPLIASNMDTIGTVDMANELIKHRCVTALHKFFTAEELFEIYCDIPLDNIFFTFGVSSADKQKMNDFYNLIEDNKNQMLVCRTDSPMICLDVANGYFERFAEEVEATRKLFPNSIIMAGNVCTPEMTEQLILSGADIVKIGIGPGSVCTTRKVAGVGYPQLSAIIECGDAAHGMGGWICGDGGCVDPGDVSKAFGGGADFVMLGGMLAGHDECGGEYIIEKIETGRKVQYVDENSLGINVKEHPEIKDEITGMKFYGMSSKSAMNKHHGGVADYRASEGKSVIVPYRGKVSDTISTILGGIRSTMTYINAVEIKHIPKATTFVRVNRQLNTSYGNEE